MVRKLDLLDEFQNAFEPIERLFQVMCAVDAKLHGHLPQYCGVVGDQLAREVRRRMEAILDCTDTSGDSDET